MYKYDIGDWAFFRWSSQRYVSCGYVLDRRNTDCNEYKFDYYDYKDKCRKEVWFREKQLYNSRSEILNKYKNG